MDRSLWPLQTEIRRGSQLQENPREKLQMSTESWTNLIT